MQISLKTGERLFINSAVIRVDRRVNLELLNDVTFLLESHVMQEANATTPLRQLYFVVQTTMIDRKSELRARELFTKMLGDMLETYQNVIVRSALKHCHEAYSNGRYYEALKLARRCFMWVACPAPLRR